MAAINQVITRGYGLGQVKYIAPAGYLDDGSARATETPRIIKAGIVFVVTS